MKPSTVLPPSIGTAATPKVLDAVMGFQLRRAHTLFALHWQQSFRDQPVRITPVQGGMLLAIESQPGLSQTALAAIMDVEGPTLVQTLYFMEEAGLVLRTRRLDDRRSYSLQLTDAGREALSTVKAVVLHREAELLSDLSNDERTLLRGLLRRVVRRAQSVTDAVATDPVSALPVIEPKKAVRR